MPLSIGNFRQAVDLIVDILEALDEPDGKQESGASFSMKVVTDAPLTYESVLNSLVVP